MKLKKSTIVLIAAAVICLGLAVVSANFSVSRTVSAIDKIGEMKLDNGSVERFQQAAEYYDAIDPNLNLTEKVSNADTLEQDRLDYARLMIKAAQLADKKQDGAAEAVAAAREAVDNYVAAENVWSIENYQDLLDLEEIYSGGDDSSGGGSDEGEAPPMC